MKIVFKEVLRAKKGSVCVVLVAENVDRKQYKSDKYGTVVTLDGKYLEGAESYADFMRYIDKNYRLTSVEVSVSGRLFPVPKKEIGNMIITTLGKSKDPYRYQDGVKVIASPNSDEIKVVLSGGDGVASFIMTWVFDDRKGFLRSEFQGPP